MPIQLKGGELPRKGTATAIPGVRKYTRCKVGLFTGY